jgi:hypothetical protein
VPSRFVAQILNRPVPELKAGWPFGQRAELNRIDFAMLIAYTPDGYILFALGTGIPF